MNELDKDLIGVYLNSIEGAVSSMQLFAERGCEDLVESRSNKVKRCIEEIKGIIDNTN